MNQHADIGSEDLPDRKNKRISVTVHKLFYLSEYTTSILTDSTSSLMEIDNRQLTIDKKETEDMNVSGHEVVGAVIVM